ncbi:MULTISPECIES: ABC transporter substrate-binding protein [Pseudomonas]|uniref:Spermidine/putrescine ABC transporter substrate-binding protein n=1 Tax=Pseudomonas marincola TaxID=437900 RepID=A0A1I7DGC3_9PSED|nr:MULTISPECIES: ABC transporter substrate-binding protein [Pseudomonas]MAB99136.1 spermidine/putrescine ABC transporter substrate-binding protein [Pseudomonadaceae bacterium]MBQ56549.1 spermidine/putrescine ABC transporter substrate-binding protein [Pseudomonadaceae bacterium]NRH28133.1 ABC transporter substrate-binding protein [Pseudomonas sp. MS19]CAE6884845.1 ABC transporter substrate-binding protein [Pseudomonas marincola]SFU10719.1 putative spermidine/putrescine transport system substrat
MARSLSTSISTFALTAALGLASVGAHAEDSLTVVSWGGAYGAAQKLHMIDPFQKDTGTKVLFEDYSGGVAEMKAQVESGNIQWDVVDVEVIDLERACSEGLLETIPRDILPAGVDGTPAEQDFIPDALSSECAIGNIVWSVVYAYNEKTIGDTKAAGIGDFFDTAKIPGKRAMRKRPQVNMEWALLADGVAPKEVYEVLATPEGQERAFKKLDTIKKDIVWFDSWSQAPQLLNDGGAVLVQSANGRFYDSIRKEGKPFVIVWDGHVYDLDAWAVLKGSPKKDLAFKFIAYATQSKPLAGMSDVAYGPTRKSSAPMMDPAAAPHLPTAHLDAGIRAGSEFWADYGESLGEKFNEWLLK